MLYAFYNCKFVDLNIVKEYISCNLYQCQIYSYNHLFKYIDKEEIKVSNLKFSKIKKMFIINLLFFALNIFCGFCSKY